MRRGREIGQLLAVAAEVGQETSPPETPPTNPFTNAAMFRYSSGRRDSVPGGFSHHRTPPPTDSAFHPRLQPETHPSSFS